MQSHLKDILVSYSSFITTQTHAEVVDRVKQGKMSNFRKDIYMVDCNFNYKKKSYQVT